MSLEIRENTKKIYELWRFEYGRETHLGETSSEELAGNIKDLLKELDDKQDRIEELANEIVEYQEAAQ